MVSRIWLVRHGESEANINPELYKSVADHAVPLSAEGHRQARAAGEFLRGVYQHIYQDMPDYHRPRIWTSPYLRTRQTTQEIVAAMGPDLVFDVREHINLVEQQFGLFDGIPDEDLPRLYPAEHAHYQKCEQQEGRFWARMPLGESRFDVAIRVHQAFGTFHRDAARHGINDLIIVAHGVVIRAFLMQWLHHPVEWFEQERNPQNCSVRLIGDGEDRGYMFAPEAQAVAA